MLRSSFDWKASILSACGFLPLVILILFCFESCRVPENDQFPNPEGFLLNRGSGAFDFDQVPDPDKPPIQVHYFIPTSGDIVEMPILIGFHGAERNAADYRDSWISIAQEKGCMVFFPEFTEDAYPGSAFYQQGNIQAFGATTPEIEWSISTISPLFEDILDKTASNQFQFDVWGHSAGAQFVNRLLLFGGELKIRTAIASNAGWYTVPYMNQSFPYGLTNSPLAVQQLDVPFSYDFRVHLGTEDTEFSNTGWSGAFEQGESRYSRGVFFFNQSLLSAQDQSINFNWSQVDATGVGHNSIEMGNHASHLLYP
jgi:poly(3-hydroxybutyrate) depolymerase